MKRTREEAEKTRQNILTSARQVFNIWGYSDTTMEEIARQAGVTRGAVYWHFNNKLDILLHVVRERTPSIITTAVEFLEGPGDPLDRITALFQYLISNVQSDESVNDITRIFIMMKDHPEELRLVRNIVTEQQRPVTELLYRIIREGISDCSLRHDVSADAIVMAFRLVIQGIWEMHLNTETSMLDREMARQITGVLISGIRSGDHVASVDGNVACSCRI